MMQTLSQISLLIACSVCKQKGLKAWYYDTWYSSKRKGFMLSVHFECCICDSLIEVKDRKLKLAIYEKMYKNYDDDEDGNDGDDTNNVLHSF